MLFVIFSPNFRHRFPCSFPTWEQLAKAEANLGKAERAVGPAYLLVLRVVLAFVVSALDYVYEAVPPH